MNRIFKITIIQPKFDELYHKYEQLNNPDRQLLEEEKEKIRNITVATHHRSYRDKWLNIRRILDRIFGLISPFNNKKEISNESPLPNAVVELYNRNLGQNIFIDPGQLPPEQCIYFEPTLRHLLEIGAISYVNFEYMDSSSEPFRRFMAGNILIKNRDIFEQYHRQISEFIDWIQRDGKERFPEVYDKQKSEIKKMDIKEPVHIVIDEIKKDIPIRGLEEKIILQKPKNKRIQLRVFPTDLKWEEISIQFLNEHEVIIKTRNDTRQATYETMGFQDEKTKLPNKQWGFLYGLSKTGGEISWKNPRATPKGKKQKQLLADTLKAYFQIENEDPFYNYKKEKAYKMKINLLPEADSVAENKYSSNDSDIEEYREEQSPQIYDA